MLMQNIVLYAVLLVAAIGALVGWSNAKKGAAWGQPLTIVCAIIAICMGLYLAYQNSSGSAANNAAMSRESAFRTAKVTVMANKLNELAPGKKAVVIIDPNVDKTKDVEVLTWKKLLNLSDDDFLAPEVPQPKAGQPAYMYMMEPVEEWFRMAQLEKMLEGKNAEVVIFCITVPRDRKISKGAFTSGALKNAKIVLAGGDLFGMQGLLNSGTALMALTSAPNAVYDDNPAPKDIQAAFNKRYLLLTKDNLKQFLTEHGEYFGLMKN